MVTSADTRPGYEDGAAHLAAWGDVFARMVDRMLALKSRAPRDAAVVSEIDRARLVANDPQLAALDREIAARCAEIAARASFARRLGVMLPLEILRDRFALAEVDIQLLAALCTIERGTAFNPYTAGKHEPLQADVAFLLALIGSNAPGFRSGELRLRFSADAPLVANGLVELRRAAARGRPTRRWSTSACASPIACSISSRARSSRPPRCSAGPRASKPSPRPRPTS